MRISTQNVQRLRSVMGDEVQFKCACFICCRLFPLI
jgi:hypothetical protein